MSKAFNDEERKLINEATLLTPDEAEQHKIGRCTDKNSDKYINQAVKGSDKGYCKYWLRSEAPTSFPPYVYFDGKARRGDTTKEAYEVFDLRAYNDNADSDVGVRPAIWINLDSILHIKIDEGERAQQEAAKKESSNTYTELKAGQKSDLVKTLQQALIAQGFLSGKADGDFGNKTTEAVKKAQTAFGMEATGIADSAFQNKLYSK